MNAPDEFVFLLDCDNTLLDNDGVQDDLRAHLEREFGAQNRDRYWQIFEDLRAELGYADYLGALQRYRLGAMNDPRLLQMSSFLVDYITRELRCPRVFFTLMRWVCYSVQRRDKPGCRRPCYLCYFLSCR